MENKGIAVRKIVKAELTLAKEIYICSPRLGRVPPIGPPNCRVKPGLQTGSRYARFQAQIQTTPPANTSIALYF